MKFPLPPGLVFVIGLFALGPRNSLAQTESPLVTPRIDARFDSDISQPPRFRDDLFDGALSQPASSRYRFEILPAPIQEAQGDELVALPDPTPAPFATPAPAPAVTATPIPTPSITPVPFPSSTPISTPVASPTPTPNSTPTPEPVPSPSVSPSPTPPSPSPTPISTPVPSPSPATTRTLAFPVPPPNPASRVQLPSVPAPAPFSPAPTLLQIQRLTPIVEVWRAGAISPQVPIRHGSYMKTAYVAGNESVMVRLQFDPLVAGKIVTVTASAAIILDPGQTGLAVRSTGDCAVTVRLGDGFNRGYVNFYCQGLQTTLPLQRSSLAVVSNREKEAAR
ncbi:MAG: hypothetical protein V7609_2833 [Verrucomicrobiota bacterium]